MGVRGALGVGTDPGLQAFPVWSLGLSQPLLRRRLRLVCPSGPQTCFTGGGLGSPGRPLAATGKGLLSPRSSPCPRARGAVPSRCRSSCLRPPLLSAGASVPSREGAPPPRPCLPKHGYTVSCSGPGRGHVCLPFKKDPVPGEGDTQPAPDPRPRSWCPSARGVPVACPWPWSAAFSLGVAGREKAATRRSRKGHGVSVFLVLKGPMAAGAQSPQLVSRVAPG